MCHVAHGISSVGLTTEGHGTIRVMTGTGDNTLDSEQIITYKTQTDPSTRHTTYNRGTPGRFRSSSDQVSVAVTLEPCVLVVPLDGWVYGSTDRHDVK